MKGVKKLEGWMTFHEAGQLLGVSRQGFHKMIEKQQLIPLDSIREIGDKTSYIVRTEAVLELKRIREEFVKANAAMEKVLEDVLSDRMS